VLQALQLVLVNPVLKTWSWHCNSRLGRQHSATRAEPRQRRWHSWDQNAGIGLSAELPGPCVEFSREPTSDYTSRLPDIPFSTDQLMGGPLAFGSGLGSSPFRRSEERPQLLHQQHVPLTSASVLLLGGEEEEGGNGISASQLIVPTEQVVGQAASARHKRHPG